MNKIKHLELIQNIISRMSGNLFLLKGWTVTLIVGLFTFYSGTEKNIYIVFSLCILAIFWLLDGYFLSMERSYRGLYDSVRKKSEGEIDFSMNYKPHRKGRNTWLRSIFSSTLVIFYGILMLVILLVTIHRNFDIQIDLSHKDVIQNVNLTE